jgi:hypothetical protein
MRRAAMPFGLDTKSVLVGLAIGAIVVPRVMAMVAARRAAPAK